jgi:hypothetical protein
MPRIVWPINARSYGWSETSARTSSSSAASPKSTLVLTIPRFHNERSMLS